MFLFSLNLFLQTGHSYGRLPEWRRKWTFKLDFLLKLLSHSGQKNVCCPAWILSWVLIRVSTDVEYEHDKQEYIPFLNWEIEAVTWKSVCAPKELNKN